MDKKSFLSHFDYADTLSLTNIYEKITLTEKTGRINYTKDFYPPVIWNKLIEMDSKFDLKIFSFGFFKEAERRIIAFSDSKPIEYPIELIKITSHSHFDVQKHGDFLGAIMALGIKREKLGDFVLDKVSCYVPIEKSFSKYIQDNLVSIGKSPCTVERVDENTEVMPASNFLDMVILSTSLRLDCIVSAICDISRNEAVNLINRGKVLVNYSEITDKSSNVENDSILTIRGYGKYKIIESNGFTAKGRLKITIKKYI
jgi:RNA-binding protein YlmH